MAMIEYYFKTAKEENFLSIPSPKEGCWIHLEEATAADLETICHLTGLDMADVQDSLDRHEIPRIEKINGHTLIFTRHPIEHDIGIGHKHIDVYDDPHFPLLHHHFLRKNGIRPQLRSKKGEILYPPTLEADDQSSDAHGPRFHRSHSKAQTQPLKPRERNGERR